MPHYNNNFELDQRLFMTEVTKPPRQILSNIFAFPPNRDTLGATAYFIVEKNANILIDCPAWNDSNGEFLQEYGGVRWLFLTHRGGISQKIHQIQACFDCEVVIQQQEAYLLPEIKVTPYQQEFKFNSSCSAFWTSGHSPGSSCVYYNAHGGVLFTGRHLLPNQEIKPFPLRTAKTFHWFRQLRNVAILREVFSPHTLHYICPGANTGYLRGQGVISNAYQGLSDLDLDALRQVTALL